MSVAREVKARSARGRANVERPTRDAAQQVAARKEAA
jgi:hypothetical protein